ncbi:hypothetical protein Ancab_028550 [Ancistrocladus abbreviatus]
MADNFLLTRNPRLIKNVRMHYLVSLLIADKEVKLYVAKKIINNSWKLLNDVSIKGLGKNTFLFVFDSKDDKLKVLAQRLWTIQHFHLSLQELVENTTIETIDFSKSPFWFKSMVCLGIFYVNRM